MSETTSEQMEVASEEAAVTEEVKGLQRKAKVTGTVKRVELYGAFVDIGEEADAILHVSQISGGKRASDAVKVGEQIEVWVDKIDSERNQVFLTMVEPLALDWQDLEEGQTYTGKVTRLENFGAFINIGAEKEGLVHVSELSHDFIRHPSQAVNVGDEVEVKVLSFSRRKRRINLSIKALLDAPEREQAYNNNDFDYEEEEEEIEEMPTSMEMALRRAMGDDSPMPRGKKKKRRGTKYNRRRSQQDIIERTLRLSDN